MAFQSIVEKGRRRMRTACRAKRESSNGRHYTHTRRGASVCHRRGRAAAASGEGFRGLILMRNADVPLVSCAPLLSCPLPLPFAPSSPPLAARCCPTSPLTSCSGGTTAGTAPLVSALASSTRTVPPGATTGESFLGVSLSLCMNGTRVISGTQVKSGKRV